MVVNVFTSHHRDGSMRPFALHVLQLIAELGLLGGQPELDFLTVVMLECAFVELKDIGMVLLLEDVGIGDRLHGGAVKSMVSKRLGSSLSWVRAASKAMRCPSRGCRRFVYARYETYW